ncbi:hypothetical protein I552_8766 [Mycobacterium xenopi 3993]|nr:hypothetical protein I552_8766 [Mycobacterium xenopi 3993]
MRNPFGHSCPRRSRNKHSALLGHPSKCVGWLTTRGGWLSGNQTRYGLMRPNRQVVRRQGIGDGTMRSRQPATVARGARRRLPRLGMRSSSPRCGRCD